jgi:hypothetical protein
MLDRRVPPVANCDCSWGGSGVMGGGSGMGAAISDGIMLSLSGGVGTEAGLVTLTVIDCVVAGCGFAAGACAGGRPANSAAEDLPLRRGSARG